MTPEERELLLLLAEDYGSRTFGAISSNTSSVRTIAGRIGYLIGYIRSTAKLRGA